jgi:hypothetical protein
MRIIGVNWAGGSRLGTTGLEIVTLIHGGADGVRTHDLLDAIEARSQLRHGPTEVAFGILSQDLAGSATTWVGKTRTLKGAGCGTHVFYFEPKRRPPRKAAATWCVFTNLLWGSAEVR